MHADGLEEVVQEALPLLDHLIGPVHVHLWRDLRNDEAWVPLRYHLAEIEKLFVTARDLHSTEAVLTANFVGRKRFEILSADDLQTQLAIVYNDFLNSGLTKIILLAARFQVLGAKTTPKIVESLNLFRQILIIDIPVQTFLDVCLQLVVVVQLSGALWPRLVSLCFVDFTEGILTALVRHEVAGDAARRLFLERSLIINKGHRVLIHARRLRQRHGFLSHHNPRWAVKVRLVHFRPLQLSVAALAEHLNAL